MNTPQAKTADASDVLNALNSSASFDHNFIPGAVKDAMKDAKAGSGDLWKVPLGEFHIIPGFNPRQESPEYLDHIEDIAKSIVAEGFYPHKPIAGYVERVDGKNMIVITDGHTRYRAAKRAIELGAQVASLPTVISPKGTNREDLTIALVKSNQGRPLTMLETAIVCKRLISYGMEVKDIAARLNYTPAYVNQLLSLLESPKEIRDMIVKGEISATTVAETIKKHGQEEAAARITAAAGDAKKNGKKVTAKNLKDKPKTQPSGPTPKALLAEMVRYVEANPKAVSDDILRGWFEEAKALVA